MSLSSRNQSIDLQSKSVDWFLYKRDIGRSRIKQTSECLFYCEHSNIDLVGKK